MTINEYQREALRTANVMVLTPQGLMENGVLGLAGEAGECADMVQKAHPPKHPR